MPGSSRIPAPTRTLPQHPSLEQLRKQAKELLEQYRRGETPAVEEVQRYEWKPDSAAFALHDAQRVLARTYGYESWAKLKAFVDGVTVARFAEAAKAGDLDQVRAMLAARPEMARMDLAESDEHRALHFAVYRRDAAMVRVLMQAGADARQGIWPHRDATSALAIARDRGYAEVVAAIEDEEQRRRRELSCPNAAVSPAQDRITAAIGRGDTATAIQMLEAEPPLIHACDRRGATPLHAAAEELSVELVAWLVARGASARKKDLSELTALDRAALAVDPRDGRERFPEVARLLIGHGGEITVRAAVALGDAKRVRELVAADPKVLREISSGGGLITLAVKHGRREMVELLLDLGGDVDERIVLENVEAPTPSWGMPLWWSALAGDLEITRLLLDRGADPNANVYASGWPLQHAWKHEPVRRLLLDRGAKPQPYMVAEAHDVEEARRLLAADASEELARELAWSAADCGCAEIVELALPRVMWAKDDPQWHWIMIQPIRGAGGDSVANEGHFRSMEALLRFGVDPNVRRFGATPLHFAAAHHGQASDEDRARFAAMLLEHGARVDLRDDILHSTALGWACRWGRAKLAATLIAHGAPVEEAGAEAWATPRAWAEKMGHSAVLEMLKSSSG